LGEQWWKRIKLHCCISFFEQFSGDFSSPFGILPNSFGWHIGIRPQFFMALTTQQVVDWLIQGFTDNVPACDFNST
jgi:hypothetical protein